MTASHPFAEVWLGFVDDRSCPKVRRIGSLGLAQPTLINCCRLPMKNFRRVQWRLCAAMEHGRRRSPTELGSLIYNAKGPAESHRR
jgi:hypothetical protein